jgi:hypothetical protein
MAQLLVMDKDTQQSLDYVPDEQLVNEAHWHRQRILQLGSEIDDRISEQANSLLWFDDDRKRCLAAGVSNIHELMAEPEIAEALWGGPLNDAASKQRLVRMMNMQRKLRDSGVNIFAVVRRSVTSSGMFTVLEREVEALPQIGAPDRKPALDTFVERLVDVGQRPWRANQKEAREIRQKLFELDRKHGIVTFVNGADRHPALKLNPDAGVAAATALNRLVGSPTIKFNLSDNELTAWDNQVPTKVAQVLTDDKAALQAMADALHATRTGG